MNAEALRKKNTDAIRNIGLSPSLSLPRINEAAKLTRSAPEVSNRVLCMFIVGACAYGMDRRLGVDWLLREGADSALEAKETEFLDSHATDLLRMDPRRLAEMRFAIEGIWALMWSASMVDDIDPRRNCSSSFHLMFPNPKKGDSSKKLCSRFIMRRQEEIIESLDLYYLLHSSARELCLRESESEIDLPIPMYAIENRRRAIEWLTSDELYWDISLDT